MSIVEFVVCSLLVALWGWQRDPWEHDENVPGPDVAEWL